MLFLPLLALTNATLVAQKIPDITPNGQVPQYGAIGQVGDEGGDFIFLKKPDK